MEKPSDGVGWIIVDKDKPHLLSVYIFPTYGKAEEHAKFYNMENSYVAEVCTPSGYWKDEADGKRRLTIP